jgi:hypothetical protein
VARCVASPYTAPECTLVAGGIRFDPDKLRQHFAAIVSVLEAEPARQILALAEALTPKAKDGAL